MRGRRPEKTIILLRSIKVNTMIVTHKPTIKMILLWLTKIILLSVYQIPPPIYQKSPRAYQLHLNSSNVSIPIAPTCSQVTEWLPWYIKPNLKFTQMASQTTKLHWQITKQTSIQYIRSPHNFKNYFLIPTPQWNYDPPNPRFEKKSTRTFTALSESRIMLFESLIADGYIHLMGPKPVDTRS